MRHVARSLLVVLLIAGSLSTAASAAPPSAATASSADRATFGIGPAVSRGQTGRPYFSYEMGVNGVYHDAAVAVNFASQPTALSIFATDVGNAQNGDFTVGLQAQQTKDAGGWIHISPKQSQIIVPARTKTPGTVLIPFTIRVPSNATPGDHGAAIVAVLSTIGKNPKGENVRFDQRIAVRIYLRVNGPLLPALTIERLHASYRGVLNPLGTGRATVTYTVHNTGNVRLAGRQAVQVTGMFGTKSMLVTPPNLQLLFPGGSETVRVIVNGVRPAIFAKARVTVTPLLFADQPQMQLHPVSAVTDFRAMPWSPLVALAAAILLIAAALTVRHRARRNRRPSKHGPQAGGGGTPNLPRPPDPQPDSSNAPASPERVHS